MSLFSLDQSVLFKICQYLCLVDRMSLKFTCQRLYIRIAGSIIDFSPIIRKRLNKYLGSATDDFLKLLAKFDAGISGSFIMACLYDEEWVGMGPNQPDIDIYENYRSFFDYFCRKIEKINSKFPNKKDRKIEINKLLGKFLTQPNLRYFWQDLKLKDPKELLKIKSNESLKTYLGYYSFLSKFFLDQSTQNYDGLDSYQEAYVIRNFPINGIHFQHIYLGTNPKKFIKHTFDMKLCQNFFDGKKLWVRSWDTLISKKDFIKPNALLLEFYLTNDNGEQGTTKYLKHINDHEILHFNNSNNVYDMNIYTGEQFKGTIIQKCLDKSSSRMDKYQNRGFNIQLHPKYHEIVQYICDNKSNRTYTYELVNENQIDLSIF